MLHLGMAARNWSRVRALCSDCLQLDPARSFSFQQMLMSRKFSGPGRRMAADWEMGTSQLAKMRVDEEPGSVVK